MVMRTYARVENGVVVEMVTPINDPEGNQYPLEVCFPPSFVEQCIEVTDMDPQPTERWTYIGGVFAEPVVVGPTPGDILQVNQSTQAYYKGLARNAMAPVLMSLQLGDATDAETTLARAWQTYYRALEVVDMTVAAPDWPVAPQ